MIFTLAIFVILLYLAFKWSVATFDHFEKQGIAFRKPRPLFGTNANFFFNRESVIETMEKAYYEFKDEKVSGLFEFRRPATLIRDPQIIKQLTVKDFDYFMDHRAFVPEDMDDLFGKTLFVLRGQKWRDMRATLSPAFTGSKMRQMMELVSQVGLQTAETLKNDIKNGGESEIEFRGMASKIAVDIIASTAFGIEVNSFKNPDNEFYRIAKQVTNLNNLKFVLKFVGFFTVPRLMKALGIHLMEPKFLKFFEHAIYDTFKIREEKGIVRHDMLNLMLEARRGRLRHDLEAEGKIVDGFATVEESAVGRASVKRSWDDSYLAAQCLIFFFAGFEPVSSIMSFVAYELARNPEIQQKLFEKVSEMNRKIGGEKINYDQLQSLKYLDQVISETLRMWPTASPAIDRSCVKDYELKVDDKKLKFRVGDLVFIPVYSIHRDPKYFPNPDKFDPDRFSPENASSINIEAYLPFGSGPRNCIGSRFALMEVKTIFYYLLLNFSFEVTEKTQIPVQFEKNPFALRPEKGIWVKLQPRE